MSQLRIGLGAIGVILGAIGALRDDRALVWVAIGAVASAVALRMLARFREPTE